MKHIPYPDGVKVKHSVIPYRMMISEAKEAEFNFKVYMGDETYNIPAQDVTTEPDKIKLYVEDTTLSLDYDQLAPIQILPKSKTINLMVKQSSLGILYYLLPIFVGLILVTQANYLSTILNLPDVGFIKGFGCGVILISYIVYFGGLKLYRKSNEDMRLQAIKSGSIPTLIKQLEGVSGKGEEEAYFTKLIHVNLKNIEEYYDLIKQQTDKSYRLTQFGSIAGFIVLIAGVIMSFIHGLDQPSTALTIASGVLIEFISTVFFYLYNTTIRQLNTYHDKLIDVQDTMLALKVAEGIKEDVALKNQTMKYLTETLTSRLKVKENLSSDSSYP